jgi:hypothetical protein
LAGNFHLQRRIAERPRKHSGDISDTNQNDDSRSLLPALLVSATPRDIGYRLLRLSTSTHSFKKIEANTC